MWEDGGVDSRVQRTFSDSEEADRRRWFWTSVQRRCMNAVTKKRVEVSRLREAGGMYSGIAAW